ncbi:MAG: sugar transferase [Kouleothrix sp.]|jgi:lipopolysaccharide/colanic/teichoic acid biosynthesis glycosyltransferase|nr:sugar transferase [Kouleothrix sp.]
MTSKRIFDIVLVSTGLMLLAPLFLLLGLLVKLDSSGPVFYKARRVGRGGVQFRMYKFRTMRVDADQVGPALTFKDDPRITRVGRWLRRFRLDELPQLINVLRGDMSLVGPRPEAPEFVQLSQPIWWQVLTVRPGICGLAQLTFAIDEAAVLNNQATIDSDYLTQILPIKLNLDLRYVQQQSLLFDLRVLAQTVLLLLRQQQQLPTV